MTITRPTVANPRTTPGRTNFRVLVVDDHPMVRRGFAEVIEGEEDLSVCGEAGDAATAMRIVESEHPELMIVDISLKDLNGIELVKQVKARHPGITMLVCSMHDESLYAERALHAGAMGYINKEESADRMIEAIRTVLDGKIFLSERMSDRLLHRMVDHEEQPGDSMSSLTDRELEVFELFGRGKSTREIAEALHLSTKTVDAHRQKIKSKLNLRNSNELIRQAVKWALEQG